MHAKDVVESSRGHVARIQPRDSTLPLTPGNGLEQAKPAKLKIQQPKRREDQEQKTEDNDRELVCC
jgi:hypothetical protein